MSSDDQDLDKLVTRVDFYSSCVEQLRKELPKYIGKQIDVDKAHKSMGKILRSAASSEPNQKLQNLLFQYAQAQDNLESEGSAFSTCEKLSRECLEESRNLLIAPLKEVIADQKALRKHNLRSSNAGNDNADRKESSSSKIPSKTEAADAEFALATLPVHVKMFEKHRVQSLKKLFSTVLRAELRYHCRVVEELSAVLQSLARMEEVEEALAVQHAI